MTARMSALEYLTARYRVAVGTAPDTLAARYLQDLADRRALDLTGWLSATDDTWAEEFCVGDLCLACGELRRLDLHDPCLGHLPDVMHACCGHGGSGPSVYVAGWFGHLEGPEAARKMRELGGHPPPRAFHLDPIHGWRGRTMSAPTRRKGLH